MSFKVLCRWTFLAAGIFFCAPAQAEAWQELRVNFFIVYYQTDAAFAGAVARAADQYYGQITTDLGYQRFGSWTWENRAKIYIYPSKEAYSKIEGVAEWSAGAANYRAKEIYSYGGQDDFLDGILPHEITHLIFMEFVGDSSQVPLWLHEGIAQWAEPAKRAEALRYSRVLLERGLAYPARDLMAMTSQALHAAPTDRVSIFYMQAISLLDFLIRSYGSGAFTTFCRALRDTQDMERSLRAAYPMTAATTENLDESWKRYVHYLGAQQDGLGSG